jgi:hypothetical protein
VRAPDRRTHPWPDRLNGNEGRPQNQ